MGLSIDSIVQVIIERQTKFPSRIGFGVPVIIDQNVVQTNKVDTFTSIQAMLDLGFATTDEAVKAATALLAQNPRPPEFRVGKRVANVAQISTVTIDTVVDVTLYTITINGTAFTFTSDGDATDVEIRDGLVTDINGGSEPVTAAPGASNEVVLTADAAGDGFSVVVDANMSVVVTTPNTSIVTELNAIRAVDDDFYFIISTSRTKQDILALAAATETLLKIYSYDTDEADSKDLPALSDTTSIMAILKALNFDRTFGVWSADLDNYPIAAWVGKNAPKDPGSITWKFTSVAGVVASSELTSTEIKNIQDKNGNVYVPVDATRIAIFAEGVVSSGEFIDIIRGTDFIQTEIQADVFTVLINEDKVPFDNGGIQGIVTTVEAVLERAKDRQILTRDQPSTVTAPDITAVSPADRAARFLRDIEFTAFYAGAIHKVRIDGSLSV